MKKYFFRLLSVVFVFAVLNACATSVLTSVWEDSSYMGVPIKKILIIGVFKDQDDKRLFEDEFVKQLKAKGANAVASYTVFSEEDIIDKETITTKMKELKFDAVLVTRVVDVKDAVGYESYPTRVAPGGFFYDYYVMCCQSVVSPGYVLILETKIFEEKYYKAIWSALSQTSLQSTKEYTIRSFIEAAVKDLQNRRLI